MVGVMPMVDPIPMVDAMVGAMPMVDPIPMVDAIPMVDPIPMVDAMVNHLFLSATWFPRFTSTQVSGAPFLLSRTIYGIFLILSIPP